LVQAINNLFCVIPQFIVTALAAAIFALVEPGAPALDVYKPGVVPPASNFSVTANPGNSSQEEAVQLGRLAAQMFKREVQEVQGGSSIGLIFRVGGVAAAVAGVLAWKLARELSMGQI
jgi:solute carrier family 45 protein 1/2/4